MLWFGIKTATSAPANYDGLTEEEALQVLQESDDRLPHIFAACDTLRRHYFGNHAHLCSIVNAKSGACSENCAFCAQSAHHSAEADCFPLREVTEIKQAYKEEAENLPIQHFGIVTSGGKLSGDGFETVKQAVASTSDAPQKAACCASLGFLEQHELEQLQRAGLKRFHHNLETAGSYFPQICTTHNYEDRLATLRKARSAGLEVCAGGILGMGESLEQRVELACTLRRENVDSIPLNFLIPIPGTALDNTAAMEPLDMLRTIAMFRLVNPATEIKVCAGRLNLRDLQSMIFHAGATGMMIGSLLTVAGRDVQEDLQMLNDLGMDYDADTAVDT